MLNGFAVNAFAVNDPGSGNPRATIGPSTVKAEAVASGNVVRLRGLRAEGVTAQAIKRQARLQRRLALGANVTARATTSAQLAVRRPMSSTVQAAAVVVNARLVPLRALTASVSAEANVISAELEPDSHIKSLTGSGTAEVIVDPFALNVVRPLNAEHSLAIANTQSQLAVNRVLSGSAQAVATVQGAAIFNLVSLGTSYALAEVNAFGGSIVGITAEREPPYRTVSIVDDASTKRTITFNRQPGDFLPYDMDLEEWLTPFPGDGIESVVVNVTEASGTGATVNDLDVSRIDFVVPQIQEPALPAIRTKVWVEGGVSGGRYKITVQMTTIGDRVKEVDFRLNVKEV